MTTYERKQSEMRRDGKLDIPDEAEFVDVEYKINDLNPNIVVVNYLVPTDDN